MKSHRHTELKCQAIECYWKQYFKRQTRKFFTNGKVWNEREYKVRCLIF